MLKGRALDHIGIACTDSDASAKWYCDVLGFEEVGKFPGKSGHPCYFIRQGHTTYEIYTPAAGVPAEVQGKVDHIAYVSNDIEADYKYALEQGYNICTNGIEAIPDRWANGCRYFKIKSPTGEEVEFSQVL